MTKKRGTRIRSISTLNGRWLWKNPKRRRIKQRLKYWIRIYEFLPKNTTQPKLSKLEIETEQKTINQVNQHVRRDKTKEQTTAPNLSNKKHRALAQFVFYIKPTSSCFARRPCGNQESIHRASHDVNFTPSRHTLVKKKEPRNPVVVLRTTFKLHPKPIVLRTIR